MKNNNSSQIHFVKVKFKSNNHLKDLKLLSSLHINMYEIVHDNDYLFLKITWEDYKRLAKYLKVQKVQDYGIYHLQDTLRENSLSLYLIVLMLIFIYFISNLTANINVIHSNPELRETITTELQEQGLKKFSLRKSFADLQNIKTNLLTKYKDSIEWLEIIRVGMDYQVRVQDKILTDITESTKYCHIVAQKEGMIRRIITSQGENVKNVNNYVRVGDIIVSGAITFNEEVKNNVCADAKVYAETWYTVNITMPKTKVVKNYTGKTRTNFLFQTAKDSYKILRSRLDTADSENHLLIKVGDYKLYYQKEKEYTQETISLSDEEVLKAIDQEITEKMAVKLHSDYQILSQKVLKKSVNDSTIYVEVFVTVEEQIGALEEYQLE